MLRAKQFANKNIIEGSSFIFLVNLHYFSVIPFFQQFSLIGWYQLIENVFSHSWKM